MVEQILSNALKYTKSGSVSIYLEQEGVLVIKDTGIGISAEDLRGLWRKAIPDTMGGSINAPPELDYIFAKSDG